jgi:hypothetical protein
MQQTPKLTNKIKDNITNADIGQVILHTQLPLKTLVRTSMILVKTD